MPLDLPDPLPQLMPRAIAWAEAQSMAALSTGRSLDGRFLAIAEIAGVSKPGNIRILDVQSIPTPDALLLKWAMLASGGRLFGQHTLGMTLGYAVFVSSGHEHDVRLLSHEFRHVHQFEQAGSIGVFLPRYLKQVFRFGYHDAPYEVDARDHELCD